MKKNDPKIINAWALYDWANSVYNLIITTAIFPIYFANATKAAFGVAGTTPEGNEIVNVVFFGTEIKSSVLYAYAISFSFLVVALISPMLSGIADYSGKKKRFMQFFTFLGGAACISLFFFNGSNVEWGIACAVLASIGYAGGVVFYNAFLPEIATEDKLDKVSARGFSFGYIGSVLLLIVNLMMVQKPEWFGLSDGGQAARASFLMVGIWWIGFAQYTFFHLKDREGSGNKTGESILLKGFLELQKVLRSLSNLPAIRTFLISFFCYNVGVQTVMLLAPTFAKESIKIEDSGLILIVLIIQIVAIGGAYLFAWVSDKKGNKFSILVMLMIWIVICVCAYLIQTAEQFYGLAVLVGMVMGGIQSLSRSTYAKLIPENTKDTASYFSFFDVTDKVAIVTGTFTFGFIEQLTGNMRYSALALIVFFVIGSVLLSLVAIPHKGVTGK